MEAGEEEYLFRITKGCGFLVHFLLQVVKHEVVEDVDKFTKDNFKNFNFPKENKGSFTVEIENRLADNWQECLEKKYGTSKVFKNPNGTVCDRIWKYMFGGSGDKEIELTIHTNHRKRRRVKSLFKALTTKTLGVRTKAKKFGV